MMMIEKAKLYGYILTLNQLQKPQSKLLLEMYIP